MLLNKQLTSTSTVATIATIAAIASAYLYYKKKRNRIPEKWTAVGKVTDLFLYPLKSGRRWELKSLECTKVGVRLYEKGVELRDRCFVVYGADNLEYKSGRTFPKLVLIETLVHNAGECVFTAPGQDPLTVKIPDPKQKAITLTLINKEPCEGVDCGDEAAVWISNFIKDQPTGLRLAYHRGVYKRDVETAHPKLIKAYPKFRNDTGGLYQDFTSYHLVCQPSVDALNRQSTELVPAKQYRPNILVDGEDLQPYAEEEWNWIKIGDAVFYNARPVTRCALTTVDSEAGSFSKKREPLTTLEKINPLKDPVHIATEGKKGVLGVYLGITITGTISVGDDVYIG